MGVEDNQYQIPNLNANTSFFDWYTKENTEVIAKLNKLKVYEIGITGSLAAGVSASSSSSGWVTFGVADTIPHGITAKGDVTITGSTSFLFDTTAASVTAGITGKFVCVDNLGGITTSSGSSLGITNNPFDKNETIGICRAVYGNTCEIINQGYYSGFSGFGAVGCCAGHVHYLDPTVAGGFTYAAPTLAGQTKKRVFFATGTAEGVIQIGDSASI